MINKSKLKDLLVELDQAIDEGKLDDVVSEEDRKEMKRLIKELKRCENDRESEISGCEVE